MQCSILVRFAFASILSNLVFLTGNAAQTFGAEASNTAPAAACSTGTLSIAGACMSAADAAAGVRAVVEHTMSESKLRAVVVSIRVGGTTVLTQAWGDSVEGVPASVDMHFRNGAIAIAYLTTVLLKLQDDGVLRVDDKLAKWLPDLPQSDKITLTMLANNTSGYADYVPVLPIYANVFRQWTPDELIASALSQPRPCEPGACFTYAHTNYVILGEVLQKATGKDVATLIRDIVVTPLGLSNTRSDQTAFIPEPVLHAYDNDRGHYEDSTTWNPSWTLAEGSIMTTNIADAVTSAIAIGKGSLLSRQAHDLQISPLLVKYPPMSEKLYFGLGVVCTNGWIAQTPSFFGYSAVMAYLPGKDIAIAVTSTSSEGAKTFVGANLLFSNIAGYLSPDQPPTLFAK
ncbi:hypothetical protein GCM10007874_39840 [Labrys miyagiensis]|uniref:Beta-lactamase-related domain-containing protein n=1 Tax=Labrys miyagiensis TaxID=346912 RepID=A0ABQ6CRR8_9HYPH|nr:serine hydrolase domain-containing protein [Labrys miyagiensis]GLS20967.1 hypothetical protein GCM10007874_39840 [Labrys miyagiensis]